MIPEKARLHRLFEAIVSLRKTVVLSCDSMLSQDNFRLIEASLEPYIDFPTIRTFLEDCRNAQSAPASFFETRKAIYDGSDLFFLGFFSAPYNQSLSLEMGIMESLEVPSEITRFHPDSNAITVNLVSSTYGFQEQSAVALFPENFVIDSPSDTSSSADRYKIFYFINKFVYRFFVYTLPILRTCTDKGAFWRIKRADESLVEQAMCTWLHLHEKFHGVGPLPLPDGLPLKSTRNTAALEESKVDMQAVLACLNIANLGIKIAVVYAEMILAERLLRYPVSYDPSENYDARGTQILFSFLSDKKAVDTESGVLGLNRVEIIEGIKVYLQKIWDMESCLADAVKSNDDRRIESAKSDIQVFINRFTPIVKSNPEGLLPFFQRVRKEIY